MDVQYAGLLYATGFLKMFDKLLWGEETIIQTTDSTDEGLNRFLFEWLCGIAEFEVLFG